MKQTLMMKINSYVSGIIRRICNHYYGCCNRDWKNCNKCKYVIGERETE